MTHRHRALDLGAHAHGDARGVAVRNEAHRDGRGRATGTGRGWRGWRGWRRWSAGSGLGCRRPGRRRSARRRGRGAMSASASGPRPPSPLRPAWPRLTLGARPSPEEPRRRTAGRDRRRSAGRRRGSRSKNAGHPDPAADGIAEALTVEAGRPVGEAHWRAGGPTTERWQPGRWRRRAASGGADAATSAPGARQGPRHSGRDGEHGDRPVARLATWATASKAAPTRRRRRRGGAEPAAAPASPPAGPHPTLPRRRAVPAVGGRTGTRRERGDGTRP